MEQEEAKDKKNIYNTSYKSIFARNFVAGFARGLGIIMVYVFLGGIIYYLASIYIIPRVNQFLADTLPIFEQLVETGQNLEQSNNQLNISPEQINRITEVLDTQ